MAPLWDLYKADEHIMEIEREREERKKMKEKRGETEKRLEQINQKVINAEKSVDLPKSGSGGSGS